MNRLLLKLCATAWLLTSPAAATPPEAVLVEGAPPLTEETVARVGGFWEWMFGAPLSGDQQAGLRQILTTIWKQDSRADIQGTEGVVAQHLQLARMSEAEREVARQTLLPRVVELLERSSADAMSRWALALYRSSHQALAAGKPPLTRQASDAYLEAICFMSNQTTGQAFVPDQRLKDGWASSLAAGYGQLEPEQQAFIARMPLLRAALAASWPKLSEAEREQFKLQWARQLGIQPGSAGSATPPAGAAPAQPAPGTDWKADLAAMQRQQAVFRGFSTAIMSNHESAMNNLFMNGDKPLRYERRK